MQDRADPHARNRAFDVAREEPPPGVSASAAASAIAEVFESIGDTCPECPRSRSSAGSRRVWSCSGVRGFVGGLRGQFFHLLGGSPTAGASFLMVIDVGNWDASRTINTPDLTPQWATGQYVPLLYSRAAIEAAIGEAITLTPR
jgi:hypothetical protein